VRVVVRQASSTYCFLHCLYFGWLLSFFLYCSCYGCCCWCKWCRILFFAAAVLWLIYHSCCFVAVISLFLVSFSVVICYCRLLMLSVAVVSLLLLFWCYCDLWKLFFPCCFVIIVVVILVLFFRWWLLFLFLLFDDVLFLLLVFLFLLLLLFRVVLVLFMLIVSSFLLLWFWSFSSVDCWVVSCCFDVDYFRSYITVLFLILIVARFFVVVAFVV
jgi:hypothetical protein